MNRAEKTKGGGLKLVDATVSTFKAGALRLGYLYQVQVALLWAIRQSRVGYFSVNVETLDDLSFEANGDLIAVLQTKHSIQGLMQTSKSLVTDRATL